eukprot:CAMPEP_0205887634 /NCGR_PEP_ID=MMETSP1083-20121108/19935_1 /ASSEMBLY_ACC=CAM_ASM_000430 /TAXON_ID=97485 /ORGANISM="Prymnesium parvum, Strain Texoma1" /LENGTH=110 /DNA_ID=CAMNT_0053251473 /DNA_START=25 /DNA_END=354 /DNA_ORIENTATION=+
MPDSVTAAGIGGSHRGGSSLSVAKRFCICLCSLKAERQRTYRSSSVRVNGSLKKASSAGGVSAQWMSKLVSSVNDLSIRFSHLACVIVDVTFTPDKAQKAESGSCKKRVS